MQYVADIANANPLLKELDLSWNQTSASSNHSKLILSRHVGARAEYRVL